MPLPVYCVQFHQGQWRIRFDERYFGQYATPEAAAETATFIANSRLTPGLQTRVVIEKDGQCVAWVPKT